MTGRSSVPPSRLGLAVAHFTTPRAILYATALDVFLELLHTLFDAPAHDSESVADVLGGALRLVRHDQADQRALGADRLEANGARVRRVAGDALPTNFLIGHLLRDFGVPFLVLTENIGMPAHMGVIELLNLGDAVHESWEFLKLRPLVVN